jgi:hypothetical protein
MVKQDERHEDLFARLRGKGATSLTTRPQHCTLSFLPGWNLRYSRLSNGQGRFGAGYARQGTVSGDDT